MAKKDEISVKKVEVTQLQKLDDGRVRASFSPIVSTANRRRQAMAGNPLGNQILTEDLDPEEVGDITLGQQFEVVIRDTEQEEVEDEEEEG